MPFNLTNLFQFVEMLMRNLKEALKAGEFENARMMVRFLTFFTHETENR